MCWFNRSVSLFVNTWMMFSCFQSPQGYVELEISHMGSQTQPCCLSICTQMEIRIQCNAWITVNHPKPLRQLEDLFNFWVQHNSLNYWILKDCKLAKYVTNQILVFSLQISQELNQQLLCSNKDKKNITIHNILHSFLFSWLFVNLISPQSIHIVIVNMQTEMHYRYPRHTYMSLYLNWVLDIDLPITLVWTIKIVISRRENLYVYTHTCV